MVFKALNIQRGQGGLMSLNPKGEGLNVSLEFTQKNLICLLLYCNFVLIIVLSSFKSGCPWMQHNEEQRGLKVHSKAQT